VSLPLRCPVCHHPLTAAESGRAFGCDQSHSFDVAADGHLNLLPSRQRHSRQPGDSKEMVRSRRAFLDAGHYTALAQALVTTVDALLDGARAVIDAGCGEGYFTRAIARAVPDDVSVCGLDVSKPAVVAAARRDRASLYVVASAFDLPFVDASVDMVLSNFAPADGVALGRVVRPGGTVITTHPGPDHLFALRQLVYDRPERHVPKEPLRNHPELFERVDRARVRSPLSLSTSEDVANLLAMTPYWWQADKAKQASIASLPRLDTELDVLLTTYRRRQWPFHHPGL
jgi:23S rRNA (guanine745-N1)-methyltransferase